MSDSKKLNIGIEMTDDELMEMTGGATFYIAGPKEEPLKPGTPTIKYGIPVAKYGCLPVDEPVYPLYGIKPIEIPLYGIKPIS